MAYPRTQHQLTVLPDGTVLATGGSRNSRRQRSGERRSRGGAVGSSTETWRTLSSGVVPRLYHSSATLLPDGRVAIGGGGHPPGFGIAEFRSEIFSPPYLFKGARPTISVGAAQANYGQSFFVGTPDGSTITKVALIPQPTPTHAYNSNSGYVPLTFSQTAGGLTVTGPANGNIAPPGMYMLFAVNANGVPSVASWVRISAPSGANPTSRLDVPHESGWKPLSFASSSTPAPAPTPAPSSPVFGGGGLGQTVAGESSGLGSYAKRVFCTLNQRPLNGTKPSRGPP